MSRALVIMYLFMFAAEFHINACRQMQMGILQLSNRAFKRASLDVSLQSEIIHKQSGNWSGTLLIKSVCAQEALAW